MLIQLVHNVSDYTSWSLYNGLFPSYTITDTTQIIFRYIVWKQFKYLKQMIMSLTQEWSCTVNPWINAQCLFVSEGPETQRLFKGGVYFFRNNIYKYFIHHSLVPQTHKVYGLGPYRHYLVEKGSIMLLNFVDYYMTGCLFMAESCLFNSGVYSRIYSNAC